MKDFLEEYNEFMDFIDFLNGEILILRAQLLILHNTHFEDTYPQYRLDQTVKVMTAQYYPTTTIVYSKN